VVWWIELTKPPIQHFEVFEENRYKSLKALEERGMVRILEVEEVEDYG
jgi:hypothetical protein